MPVYVSEYGGSPLAPLAVTAATAAGLNSRSWYLGKRGRGRNDSPDSTTDEFAIVWTSGAVSGTGIILLANNPNDALTTGRRNAINTRLGTTFPAGTTLRQVVRYVLRQMPRRFRQAPIDNDGMVRIALQSYLDEFSQDDDPAQCLDPPMAASYPPVPGRV